MVFTAASCRDAVLAATRGRTAVAASCRSAASCGLTAAAVAPCSHMAAACWRSSLSISSRTFPLASLSSISAWISSASFLRLSSASSASIRCLLLRASFLAVRPANLAFSSALADAMLDVVLAAVRRLLVSSSGFLRSSGWAAAAGLSIWNASSFSTSSNLSFSTAFVPLVSSPRRPNSLTSASFVNLSRSMVHGQVTG